MSSSSSSIQQTEDLLCAISLALVSVLCVSVHSLIVFRMLFRIKSPFSVLCISRSMAHLLSSVSMTVSMAGPLFAGHEIFSYGLNVVTVPEVSLYPSEFFLALNRFISISFPCRYNKIFRKPTLAVMICLSWIIGAVVLGESLLRDCVLTFDAIQLKSHFPHEECYSNNRMGQILILPFVFSSLLLNFFALANLIRIAKQSKILPTVSEKAMDSGLRLFVFTFSVSLLWLGVQIVWWMQLVDGIQTRVGKFFFNTMFSNGGHLLEGLLLILCYFKEISPTRKYNIPTIVIT